MSSKLKTLNKPTDLKTLQGIVQGLIEVITLENGDQIIVNEEGLLLGLPINEEASEIVSSHFGFPQANVGNAVILKGEARLT